MLTMNLPAITIYKLANGYSVSIGTKPENIERPLIDYGKMLDLAKGMRDTMHRDPVLEELQGMGVSFSGEQEENNTPPAPARPSIHNLKDEPETFIFKEWSEVITFLQSMGQ